ncbi:MAG: hypothetical protein DMF62_02200 [Acidobacteria bacterium]|nr:MAG: hypothetical protein DMF62_02200 [Acidobacteriota bacterium]
MRHFLALIAVLFFAGCGSAPIANNQTQPVTSNQTQPAATNQERAASPTEVPVPDAKTASADEIEEYLLTSAADDFHTTIKSGPVRVRDVRFGRAKAKDGTDQYRLCGEFLAEKKDATAEWTAFATIKTSGYEQYNGAQATDTWCKKGSFIPDKEGDLSGKLQSKLDAPR